MLLRQTLKTFLKMFVSNKLFVGKPLQGFIIPFHLGAQSRGANRTPPPLGYHWLNMETKREKISKTKKSGGLTPLLPSPASPRVRPDLYSLNKRGLTHFNVLITTIYSVCNAVYLNLAGNVPLFFIHPAIFMEGKRGGKSYIPPYFT